VIYCFHTRDIFFAREQKKVVKTHSNFFWARFNKFPKLFSLRMFFFVFYLEIFVLVVRELFLFASDYTKTVKLQLQDYEFDDVAWAICSQEHMPSNHFCTGLCTTTVRDYKKIYIWIRVILSSCQMGN